ncbi:MAG: peptidoglycan-binding protein, partial [Deltaproteobacteria bacterium]
SDVAAVQDHLRETGYLDGPADGTFGAATQRAVAAWRADLGIPTAQRRTVPLGDIVFVPFPPPFVVTALSARVGYPASPFQDSVTIAGEERVLEVTADPLDDATRFVASDGRDLDVIETSADEEGGGVRYLLQPADGSDPATVDRVLRSTLIAEQAVLVPALALHRKADGTIYVWCRPQNASTPWQVCPVDAGPVVGTRVVIEGLDPGTMEVAVP